MWSRPSTGTQGGLGLASGYFGMGSGCVPTGSRRSALRPKALAPFGPLYEAVLGVGFG